MSVMELVQALQGAKAEFGVSARVGPLSNAEPGAFSLTCVHARSEADIERIASRTPEIFEGLRDLPGFISGVVATVGLTMYTMTAWETPEAAYRINDIASHREGVREFFAPDGPGLGGQTGVWVPHHMSMMVRCDRCGTPIRLAAERCACGATPPESPAYW